MSKLNRDVLYLIFEEFQDDENTLHSCLLVNKTWCEIIIPILWKNPWKNLKREKEKSLLNVIISHLSGESKNNLKNLVKTIINAIDKDSEKIIIKNDIFSLFINEHTRFTHLYIPFQVFLIPGTKCCFSEIEFLSCNTSVNDNILVELTEICKSIKELELIIEVQNNNYQIIKLIKTQKKLFSVSFLIDYLYNNTDETFRILLENSLIRHANTIQYFKATRQPATQILSSFVNLRILELDCISIDTWNCLENLSLPFLQILKANQVPIKALTRLIENTSGFLIEINIDYKNHDELRGNMDDLIEVYKVKGIVKKYDNYLYGKDFEF
ncbi:hypothetical protein GLOIN_2v1777651 [Rhizophagus irregularis DAOM 181602=DAOM 197198]|nr:hypothetical protein GLOIN_2v1777651 [Rhizophagus irregularis DAOM 181602=DAOM 197198]